MAKVLIVDDEELFVSSLAELLKEDGHQVLTADSLAEAKHQLTQGTPDLLLLDLMLPDGNGLELFDAFHDGQPKKIIIITGHGSVRNLIGGMAGDGVSYMRKPIEARDLDGVLNALSKDDEKSTLPREHKRGFGLLYGESKAMQQLYQQIKQVAVTNSTVFVQGESGTGKELVAEMLHRSSGRKGPFVPVNCGGLSKDLLSSQLFGHEKGSFTGAERQHVGFFERADGGTLFLDELTEMPVELQVHLLRVLETQKIMRLGSEKEIKVNARLVAATNRDPREAVNDGLLREDLYFRLSVFPLQLPPLRARHGDVPLLAQHFLDQINKENDTNRVFADDMLSELQAHHWPGNVRELKHAVHRAYIMSLDDLISPPPGFLQEVPSSVEGVSVGRSIADVEKDLILSTLEHFEGDKNATASTLGVSLKTLYNRLKSYDT
jgi:DNA-binding NtrC family response regulator